VALVGDAAGCISLLGGEGTGIAMVSAFVLAEELGRGEPAAAFAAWQARVKPWVERKQEMGHRLMGFFAPKTWLGLYARDALLNLTRLPGMARLLLGGTFGDEPDLFQPA
jgi:2-polyprenyl-6-methoxyphenol hydroxylase-like FAD-dependent oxidoreductase